ncbi:MAG: HAD-IA family hydrolase [candidate division Zixibacteria bacterium]|nr:HAD-IA family hydrolase [candidate division Zixibacteria bacterium]
MSIKLVIFDLDGTLVDSSADVVDCFKYAFEKEGLEPLSEDEIKPTIGYPLKEVLGRYGDAERMHANFIEKAKIIMGDKTELLPGACEALEEIHKRGINIAIATTKIRQNTRRIIQKLGIDKYIGELSGADDVKKVKPAPEALIRLLDYYKVNKNQAIMVGDTINDILAARNAGVRCAAVMGGFDPIEKIKQAKPEWIIESTTELLDIISNE